MGSRVVVTCFIAVTWARKYGIELPVIRCSGRTADRLRYLHSTLGPTIHGELKQRSVWEELANERCGLGAVTAAYSNCKAGRSLIDTSITASSVELANDSCFHNFRRFFVSRQVFSLFVLCLFRSALLHPPPQVKVLIQSHVLMS